MASEGTNIRLRRQAKNLTQDALARKIGVSRSRIQQIETSSDPIPTRLAEPLADALGLDISGTESPWAKALDAIGKSDDHAKLFESVIDVLAKLPPRGTSVKTSTDPTADLVKTEFLWDSVTSLWSFSDRLANFVNSPTTEIPDFSAIDLWTKLLWLAKDNVKAIHCGPIKAWWNSQPGRDYLNANLGVAKRGCKIERLFIIPEEKLRSAPDETPHLTPLAFNVIKQLRSQPNISVRYRHSDPSVSLPSFLLVDDQFMISEVFNASGMRDYSVLSVDKWVIDRAKRTFKELFDGSNDVSDLNPDDWDLNDVNAIRDRDAPRGSQSENGSG
jgi:transcriptional regulator with XRE-family HTH domain